MVRIFSVKVTFKACIHDLTKILVSQVKKMQIKTFFIATIDSIIFVINSTAFNTYKHLQKDF